MPKTAGAVKLRRLAPTDASTRLDQLLGQPYAYRAWEDVYREEWSWDKVVNVTHIRANCISACSLQAFVRDGIVWREEQNATYEQAFEDVPDYNPRGCVAGCAYSMSMYDPTRIKYPMKRIGPRGSGQWQRLSWDEALSEIADKIIDVIVEDGPECIVFDHGTTNADSGIATPLEAHVFGNGLGGSSIDSWAGVGDLPVGLLQSWGTYMSEGTADDWFLADYILIWLGNPNYTRPADAALHLGGPLPGRQGGDDRPRLLALHPPRRPLAERSDGNRRRHGPGHGERHPRRGPPRRGVHQGADRPPVPGAHRYRALPAGGRPGGGRLGHRLLLLECQQAPPAPGRRHMGLRDRHHRVGPRRRPRAVHHPDRDPPGRHEGQVPDRVRPASRTCEVVLTRGSRRDHGSARQQHPNRGPRVRRRETRG